MAEGGLGISTGIGQGEAQIIRPFQSPVTPQQYGAVMATQQKAKADEAAKKAKRLSDVESFDFKGLPQQAELFVKGYQDILNFVAENQNDPMVDLKMKQKMADLKTKANMSVDLKNSLQKTADLVKTGEGKNWFLGFDEAVKGAVTPIDFATFSDTGSFGETIGSQMNLLNSVKAVPKYDVGSAKKDLQNQIEGWAKANKTGASWKADDTVIDTFVDAEIAGHPEAVIHFGMLMKSDPVGAKAANNDPIQYGKNVLRKEIKAEGFDKAGGGIYITNNPAETELGIGGVYDNVGFGLGGGVVNGAEQPKGEMLMSGFSFTPKNSITLPPTEAFDTTTYQKPETDGNIQLKSGQVVLVSIADRDINVPGFGVIPKGSPIPTGGAAGEMLKKLNIPVKKAWYVIGVDENIQKTIAVPFNTVRSAIEGGLTKTGLALFNENIAKLADTYNVQAPLKTSGAGNASKATAQNKPAVNTGGGANRFNKKK